MQGGQILLLEELALCLMQSWDLELERPRPPGAIWASYSPETCFLLSTLVPPVTLEGLAAEQNLFLPPNRQADCVDSVITHISVAEKNSTICIKLQLKYMAQSRTDFSENLC